MDRNNNYNDIKKDLTDASKKAGSVAEDTYNNLKEKGKDMMHNLEDKAYEMGTKTREVYDDIEHKLKDGMTCIEKQIKERPLLSVGIAMLIGRYLTKMFSK